MKNKFILLFALFLLASCGGTSQQTTSSIVTTSEITTTQTQSEISFRDEATITVDSNEKDHIKINFEKNQYFLDDIVNFNIETEENYEVTEVSANGQILNKTPSNEYEYSFTALIQNTVTINVDDISKYTEPQPIAYVSFDQLDANKRYFDEVSGSALYQIGEIPQVDGTINKAAQFRGESSLSFDCEKLPFKNNPHTVMATVHIDQEDINKGSENVIVGWGEYRHLSDTRLMIYHGQLCITSFDVCNFCDIPQKMIDGYVNLTMTYTGKEYKLYIDGEYMMAAAAPSGINIKESPLYIGGFGANILNYVGNIDEVYVFDQVINEETMNIYSNNEAMIKKQKIKNNEPTRNGTPIFNPKNAEFKAGGWNEFQYIEGSTILPISIYIPEDYNGSTNFRFLTFLHGDGSNGQSCKNIINGSEAVTVKRTIEENEDTIILVASAGSPWLPVPNDNSPEATKYPYKNYDMYEDARPSTYLLALDKLMADMTNNLPIIKEEVYLAGYSRGTMGVWWLLANYPNRFAAAICCCGQGDPKLANTLRETPLWVFHGTGDNLVDINGIQNVVDAIKEEGGDVKFTTYRTGHDMSAFLNKEDLLVEWLYSHKNNRLDSYSNGIGTSSNWKIENNSYETRTKDKLLIMLRNQFLTSGTVEFDLKLGSEQSDGGLIVASNRQTITTNDSKEHSLLVGKFNNKIGLHYLDGSTISPIEKGIIADLDLTSNYSHVKFYKDTANKQIKLEIEGKSTDWISMDTLIKHNKFIGLFAQGIGTSIKDIYIDEKNFEKAKGYSFGVGGESAWKINESEQTFESLTTADQILIFAGKEFTGGTLEWDMKCPTNQYMYNTVCGMIFGANKQDIISGNPGEDYYVFGRYNTNIFVGFSKCSGAFAWENTKQIDNIDASAGENFYHYSLEWDAKNNKLNLHFGDKETGWFNLNKKYGNNKYVGLYTESKGVVIKNIKITNN